MSCVSACISNQRVAFDHRALNDHCAFHSVEHAPELSQDAVTRRVDDATAVPGDHRGITAW